MSSLDTICPVCDCSESDLIFQVTTEEAANVFAPTFLDGDAYTSLVSCLRTMWGDEVSVVRCRQCTLGYASPYVSGNEEFYTLAYPRSEGAYPQDRWEFFQTCSHARKLVGSRKDLRILELGAGDGGFARQCKTTFSAWKDYLAIEYSDYAREKLKALGVEAIGKDIRQLSSERDLGVFDLICFFQVLEHLDGLKGLFSILHESLAENGRIYISVPSADWVDFHEANGGTLDMPPNHVARWNRQAFEHLAATNGLEVEDYALQPSKAWKRVWNLAKYRFYRSRQTEGTLASRTAKIRRRSARSVFQGFCGILEIFKEPVGSLKIYRDPGLSPNIWVCLRKK